MSKENCVLGAARRERAQKNGSHGTHPPPGKTRHRRGKPSKPKAEERQWKCNISNRRRDTTAPRAFYIRASEEEENTEKKPKTNTNLIYVTKHDFFFLPRLLGVHFPRCQLSREEQSRRWWCLDREDSPRGGKVAREISYCWLSGRPSRHKLE